MWAHYSEGHRGVAIGVTIDDSIFDVRPIQYTGPANISNGSIDSDSPRDILSHKFEVWKYEEEERVFVKNDQYVNVVVKQIITGRKMNTRDYSFIRELVQKINPSIEIIKAETFM